MHSIPVDADTFFIHDLVVVAKARKQGIAKRLLAMSLDVARSTGLNTATLISVEDSFRFWRTMGFEQVKAEGNPQVEKILSAYQDTARYMQIRL